MNRKNILIILAIAVIVNLATIGLIRAVKNPGVTTSRHITVSLRDGKPTSSALYQVNNGDRLKFTVNSDGPGDVSTSANPEQKVTMDKGAKDINLVADRSGTFKLTFLPKGSKDPAVTIATIQVK